MDYPLIAIRMLQAPQMPLGTPTEPIHSASKITQWVRGLIGAGCSISEQASIVLMTLSSSTIGYPVSRHFRRQ